MCDICIDNFFFIEDIVGFCVELHREPENYYLDHDLIFKKCPTNCQKCVKNIDENILQKPTCLLCYEGNHFYEMNPGICMPKRDIPWGTYYDEISNTYYKCLSSCKTCKIGGTTTMHNCLICANNYSFVEDQPTNCISTSTSMDGYYLDYSTNTFLKCHSHCATCFNETPTETKNKCLTCINGFYFIETLPTSCIQWKDIPENFYFDGNQFIQCHINCKTCSFRTEYDCLLCLDGWHFLREGANYKCIREDQKPNNYYWDGDIYRQCYTNCATCENGGTSTAHFCKTCITHYYFNENDSNYNCMNTPPGPNYYTDETTQTYRWCHWNCATCETGYVDNVRENCKSCKPNEYFIETHPTNCIDPNTTDVSHFYLDWSTWTYRKCHINCESCIMGGSNTTNNCSKCKNGFHFIFTNPMHCIDETSSWIWSDYYLDWVDNMYKKCGHSCATCEGTENNCSICKPGYSKENVDSNNCVNTTDKPYFYLDIVDNTFKPCYSSCYSCSQGGDSVTHHCSSCFDSTYHWIFDRVGNCITQDNKPVNYYWDTISDTYKPCHTNCYKCVQLGNRTRNLCTECISNFYFKEGEDTTTCFNRYDIPENYFIDTSVTPPIARKCFSQCQTCNEQGNNLNAKCTSCAWGFYFKYHDTVQHCYSKSELTNYYIDTNDNLFKPCYIGCGSCNQAPDWNNHEHYCTSCKPPYYPLENKASNCYQIGGQPSDFFYDATINIFRKCHVNCNSCSGAGTDMSNKCTTCAANFAFISTLPTNCIEIDSQPDEYYYDILNNTYLRCYSTCGSCDKWGNSDRHECKSCTTNYSFITWYPTNCIQQGTEPQDYVLNYSLNTYIKCYNKCETCFDFSTNETEMKCWSCYDGWEITTNHYANGEAGNCIQSEAITQENVDIDMFVPANDSVFINESLVNNYHIKEVKVGMYLNFSIYYYLVNRDISITPSVSINEECLNIWKTIYKWPWNTHFIVGQYVNHNILYSNSEINSNSFKYEIYSDTGVNLDLVFCGDYRESVKYRANQNGANVNTFKESRRGFAWPKWSFLLLLVFV